MLSYVILTIYSTLSLFNIRLQYIVGIKILPTIELGINISRKIKIIGVSSIKLKYQIEGIHLRVVFIVS